MSLNTKIKRTGRKTPYKKSSLARVNDSEIVPETRSVKVKDVIDFLAAMINRLKEGDHVWLQQCINQIFNFRCVGCITELEAENLGRSILRQNNWCSTKNTEEIKKIFEDVKINAENFYCPSVDTLAYAVSLKNRFGFRVFKNCLAVTAHSIVVTKGKRMYYVTTAKDERQMKYISVINDFDDITKIV